MIPEGWENIGLGDVVNYKKGFAFISSSYSETGVRLIRISDTTRNSIHNNSPVYVSDAVAQKQKDYALNEGDIILSSVGSRPHLLDSMVGKAVRIPHVAKGGLLNQNLVKLMPIAAHITDDYLYEMLKKPIFIHFISTLVRGNANQVSITLKELFQYKFLLPPLPEQKKIAQILSTWDKAIETVEKLIANSQQKKKALMQQLLTGKKRLAGFSDDNFAIHKGFAKSKLGGVPESWKVEPIKDYFWYQEGPGVRKHQFTEIGVKLFNGTNIQNSQINLFNTKTCISEEEAYGSYAHFLADSDDLVIACSGISVDRFDEKIAFLDASHLPLCMNTSTMRFKPLNNEIADINYFKYFMMSPLFKNQIRRQITGSAQLNFGPSHVGKCYVVLPHIEEQQKIASVLSVVDCEIDTWQQELAHLKQEKKALMQQLLTGKRRVKIDDILS